MCGKRKKNKWNKKENLKAHVWSDWCATAWCWEVGCRILYIKFVGAAVIFVKIARPQISAGMGLNLSHEQVSQCLSFAAKLGIGKNTFFFPLWGRVQKETKALGQNARQYFAPWGEWIAVHYGGLHSVCLAQRKGQRCSQGGCLHRQGASNIFPKLGTLTNLLGDAASVIVFSFFLSAFVLITRCWKGRR